MCLKDIKPNPRAVKIQANALWKPKHDICCQSDINPQFMRQSIERKKSSRRSHFVGQKVFWNSLTNPTVLVTWETSGSEVFNQRSQIVQIISYLDVILKETITIFGFHTEWWPIWGLLKRIIEGDVVRKEQMKEGWEKLTQSLQLSCFLVFFFLPSIFLTFGRIFQNIISKLSISLFPFLDA